jgi:Family of unknown function (DUF6866) C-terminal domain/Family of unknown function (DUF6866) N-terminal domain
LIGYFQEAAMPQSHAQTTAELNLGALLNTVQKNCHISDAQFAGDLTMCIFLLRMRELYRWENDIPLSQNMPNREVGDWMNARSQLWEQIETDPYVPLPLPSGEVDPFEVKRANRELNPLGLVYSGGYGGQCKPHFFLGRLDRVEEHHGHTVYVSGCEYARDLEAPPGMMLDSTVFVRTEALRRWLWERYEEWCWNPQRNEAMGRAVACYPFDAAPEDALTAMTQNETEAVILHELGEARADAELGAGWPAMLTDVLRSRAEIVVRAVRDLYADCLSTLPGLLEMDRPACLHFYFANFGGLRRRLFPELAEAYGKWAEGGSPAALGDVARAGRERWDRTAREIMALHQRLGDQVGSEIEARLAPREVH